MKCNFYFAFRNKKLYISTLIFEPIDGILLGSSTGRVGDCCPEASGWRFELIIFLIEKFGSK